MAEWREDEEATLARMRERHADLDLEGFSNKAGARWVPVRTLETVLLRFAEAERQRDEAAAEALSRAAKHCSAFTWPISSKDYNDGIRYVVEWLSFEAAKLRGGQGG